ncbi:GntG family PLP-dependent aldolase [Streptomyces sp. NPDC004284]|uniref:GntG family PLP-dependent aldolase n=1 Tax=Streptomyces sp. NPDC004284 TaxID=3364695 RepID=UPI0036B98A15
MRSDTFTLPTPAMMKAMADAPLGDDVYGEDPTVRALEELAAGTLGKQAACLTPSGTMANLAAIMAQAPRGAKALVGTESDIYIYEAGGASVCGGVVYEPVPTQPDGRLLISDLAKGFPDDTTDPQFALPALICLENTQNRCGGVILPQEYLRDVRRFADERGVRVHLDGARIFNAAVGSGVEAAEIAQYADSVQFCLSKGLSAPIGSVVAGDEDFITEVRRIRKMLGGGMRQAGLIAAAGIVAIENADRLAEDHANARRLATGLAEIDGIETDPGAVQTNIVMFRVTDPRFTWSTFVEAVRDAGLAVGELGHGRVRAVTHAGVNARDIDRAVDIVRQVLAA